MPVLPSTRPSRVVVEPVRPIVDGGQFAAKATVGEPTTIVADVFTDGHSLVAAAVRYRQADPPGASWHEVAATSVGNDRFEAAVVFSECGVWEYEVLGWIDHFEGWRRDTRTKIAAGVGVDVELQAGAALLESMLDNASGADRAFLEAARRDLASGDATVLDDASWPERSFRCSPRDPIARLAPLRVDVDPVYGAFGAWYEFFPRSTVSGLDGFEGVVGGDLEAARKRLDYVSSLGFDIVYLPPISPIGITKRKGRNNSTEAAPDDVGSPWAIGSADGGHTAVSPELGTVDDVVALVDACHERGLRLALDIAFQCSPDHPWVSEHPQWFAHRADGTIQYAENPPKKYEDIYPLDFETEDWRSLWEALADVFRFWIERGVRIFRVDNPHTKAIAFWEWALGTLRSEYPDTVFLAEAFTRPRVMERLAKVGFSQSYTYFTWRQGADELADYFEDLSTRTVDFFRPNAWPNTPDILTEQLQRGGRAAFVTRAVLAATLSPSWGVYGPAFELMEHRPVREGSEEYQDSEKYQVRHWELDRDDSLAPLLARLNEIRAENRSFRFLDTLRFHRTSDPSLLCFSKVDRAGISPPVLVVVNLDEHHAHQGFVDVDLAAVGLSPGSDYRVTDLLGGGAYEWSGNWNYVELSPWAGAAHVFVLEAHGATDTAPSDNERWSDAA